MKIFRYRLTPVFFVIWLVALFFLHREVVSESFLTKDALIDINDGALIMRQDYMGFYLGGEKIGFSRFVLKEDNDDAITKLPGKYFVFHSDSYMKITALGMPVEVKINQTGEVNEDLSLRSFRFSFSASGQNMYTMGVVEDGSVRITTKGLGSAATKTIKIDTPIYHPDMIHLVLARDGLEVGQKKTFPVFNPMPIFMKQETLSATVDGIESIDLPDGETAKTFKVTAEYLVWNPRHG